MEKTGEKKPPAALLWACGANFTRLYSLGGDDYSLEQERNLKLTALMKRDNSAQQEIMKAI